jgi:hypothetical protein
MGLSRQDGDLYVNGALASKSFTPPASCIGDAAVVASAGIQSTKLQQQPVAKYAQPGGSTAVTERKETHTVYGATAKIASIKAGLIVANIGAATITVDLLKNGSSILTSVITLDNTVAAYGKVNGVVASPNLVQNDVLEVNVVATAGGGTIGKGVFAHIVIQEDPQ